MVLFVQSVAHEEDGSLANSIDFPYDQVDRDLNGVDLGDEEVNPEEIAAAAKAFRQLVQWLWQDGMQDNRGLNIRATIVSWVFLEEVRLHTESDLARKMGLHKQSLDRWFSDFKRQFPHIKTSHMRNK